MVMGYVSYASLTSRRFVLATVGVSLTGSLLFWGCGGEKKVDAAALDLNAEQKACEAKSGDYIWNKDGKTPVERCMTKEAARAGGVLPSNSQLILASYQLKIIKNGKNITADESAEEHVAFKESMDKLGDSTLLAASNTRTEWHVEPQSKKGESFYSKLIPPEVLGDGLHYEKVKASDHTYKMYNFFVRPGKTEASLKIAPIAMCKQKYTDAQCANIDSVPEDVTAMMKVPIKVMDTGRRTPPEIAICDAIGPGMHVVGFLTVDAFAESAAEYVARLAKLNARCI